LQEAFFPVQRNLRRGVFFSEARNQKMEEWLDSR
jgi:hypothetical protein